MKTKILVVVLGVAALVALGCATQSAKPVAGMACAECGCGMMKAEGGKPMMHMMMSGHGKADQKQAAETKTDETAKPADPHAGHQH